ncbi:hypothetical protein ACQQCD_10765 [Pseudarthrobacter sp. J1763]|uniref:sunset domain-containing protein n=1 Tax=Pseudarthrobacter sp. J1763 TaxID=3420445 RepID=UPI003D27F24A
MEWIIWVIVIIVIVAVVWWLLNRNKGQSSLPGQSATNQSTSNPQETRADSAVRAASGQTPTSDAGATAAAAAAGAAPIIAAGAAGASSEPSTAPPATQSAPAEESFAVNESTDPADPVGPTTSAEAEAPRSEEPGVSAEPVFTEPALEEPALAEPRVSAPDTFDTPVTDDPRDTAAGAGSETYIDASAAKVSDPEVGIPDSTEDQQQEIDQQSQNEAADREKWESSWSDSTSTPAPTQQDDSEATAPQGSENLSSGNSSSYGEGITEETARNSEPVHTQWGQAEPVQTQAAQADPAPAEPAQPVGHLAVDKPYGEGSASPNPDGSAPEGFTVKGDAGSMIYHDESSPLYNEAAADVWFISEAHAEAAGFRVPRQGRH